MKPQPRVEIILGADVAGVHNESPTSYDRVVKGQQYRDVSTIIVIPTRGVIPARVVESWMNLMAPMNHPLVRMFVSGAEVGSAYNEAFSLILTHPQLSQMRYVLTLEEDNLPQPDGLLRLLESIEGHAAVGGLYWTKGDMGQPMIYGNPDRLGEPDQFAPQKPDPDQLVECNGLGMGFTLFDLSIFRDLDPPWFVTQQEFDPMHGAKAATQDLYAFERIRNAGHKVACDTRVKVGHYDHENRTVW